MNQVIHGDCIDELKKLADNSVDLLCTDPPYGYSFMGKNWDKAVPSVEIWKECLRVLKPGAFAFVMSAPRQDVLSQMIVRIGEAGFDTFFTSIYWTYASGFPKAMNIGKAVDKRSGSERKVIGPRVFPDGSKGRRTGGDFNGTPSKTIDRTHITRGTSPLEGSYGGFQPKPAVEVIIVAMKPLSEKTFVDQAVKNGKGVTWLDDTRIPTTEPVMEKKGGGGYMEGWQGYKGEYGFTKQGRFPANLLVSDDVLNDHSRFFSVDEWAQTLPFLAVPKASKREKNEGTDLSQGKYQDETRVDKEAIGANNPRNRTGQMRMGNFHPTVKPLKLMSYLITLGSREGDTVLDPFAGSCTTALAAKHLKRNYIAIEREAEYVGICEARLDEIQPTLV